MQGSEMDTTGEGNEKRKEILRDRSRGIHKGIILRFVSPWMAVWSEMVNYCQVGCIQVSL